MAEPADAGALIAGLGAIVFDHKNTPGGPYGITQRPASPPGTGSRCQRVSPVRLMRVMLRRLRSRHTPYAEMWLLPVAARRHEFFVAARTPLRTRIAERAPGDAATGADWRTAARRSRGKYAAIGESGNILLAPSMRPAPSARAPQEWDKAGAAALRFINAGTIEPYTESNYGKLRIGVMHLPASG